MTEPAESEFDAKAHPGGGALRRLVPAVLMIAVGLSTAIAGGWFFAALVVVAAVLMMLEWQSMTAVDRTSPTGVLQSAVCIAAIGLAAWGAPEAGLAVVGIGSVAAAVAASIGRLNVGYVMIGVLYIGLPSLAAIWLRHIPEYGLANILWLYAVVWAGDTGAYGFGRWIGGPRLASAISPNKTWAGAIGGTVASIAAGVAAAALLSDIFALDAFSSIWIIILISFVIAVVSQAGDLLESLFKRAMSVKDSGTLLPGHGGVLDRLDGFLAAVGFAFLLYALFAIQGPLWGG